MRQLNWLFLGDFVDFVLCALVHPFAKIYRLKGHEWSLLTKCTSYGKKCCIICQNPISHNDLLLNTCLSLGLVFCLSYKPWPSKYTTLLISCSLMTVNSDSLCWSPHKFQLPVREQTQNGHSELCGSLHNLWDKLTSYEISAYTVF